ncbi:hypothetical protein SMB34_14355 [Thalassospira permensis NBRC 106175]|uniref:Uncharacterized protein n=1 Tax=Thalassospira permensis NBRC 106175 TaxID=1353532 RepID=A0ABR4TS73_9PROT|nr:hypothetical protein SMB34_14355 [Thalassospira permensis NBRC 106175]
MGLERAVSLWLSVDLSLVGLLEARVLAGQGIEPAYGKTGLLPCFRSLAFYPAIAVRMIRVSLTAS